MGKILMARIHKKSLEFQEKEKKNKLTVMSDGNPFNLRTQCNHKILEHLLQKTCIKI